jgi:DNA repair protein RadC
MSMTGTLLKPERSAFHSRIADLPLAGRPRERLLLKGPGALKEAELLAVLLGTGDGHRSALELAEALLAKLSDRSDSTGLKGLQAACCEDLKSFSGLGPAKAARLLAALELGKRVASLPPAQKTPIVTPADAYRLLAPHMAPLDREVFWALLLDSKHQLLAHVQIAVGTLNATLVHPRELFKEAIRKSACAMVLAHNHPSGDPTPSEEDLALTRQLLEGGRILGMKILDHLVIGDGRFVSLRETSAIWIEQPFHQ